MLSNLAENNNIIFINLYVTDACEIYKRISNRDSTSYMLGHVPFIFQTNNDLYLSTEKIANKYNNIFNVNVTELNIDNTIKKIISCIKKQLNNRFLKMDFDTKIKILAPKVETMLIPSYGIYCLFGYKKFLLMSLMKNRTILNTITATKRQVTLELVILIFCVCVQNRFS